MVSIVTSAGRSGLHDWIIQRATAVILIVYILYLTGFLTGFFTSTNPLSYSVWRDLFAQTGFKVFSLLALFAICFHAWVGLWVVATDYIKPLAFRAIFQMLVIISCFALLIWGALILWSV